jgi:hypothetical protein
MRWAGHVARMGRGRGAYRVLVDDVYEEDHLENLSVNRRIILKSIFRRLKEHALDYKGSD